MRFLSKKGLSMSQAQSVSNLCNQAAQNIDDQLSACNNASKTFNYNSKDYTYVEGKPLPENLSELLIKKAKYHACQAFLMEAIEAKEDYMDEIRNNTPLYDVSAPEKKSLSYPKLLDSVDDSWGWSQLTDKELAEYYEAEAYAAHIGKFIHKKGKLTVLRSEINTLPGLEFVSIKDSEKTPVIVNKHHSSAQLNDLHEDLATLHRKYEQRVNYYKAKVKNLVSEENARIHRVNSVAIENHKTEQAKLDEAYNAAFTAFMNTRKAFLAEAESQKELKLKEAAQLRIVVDPRFQEVVDEFLSEEK